MKTKYDVSQVLNNMPLIFEKNIGQYEDIVKFASKQNRCTTYFTKDDVVLSLVNNNDKSNEVNLLKISLEESNKNCDILGINELSCKVSYFKGKTEKEWITEVPVYEKLIYKEIYPSIDLVYYSNKDRLEHDFIIKPHANIENIKFNFDVADSLSIDTEGNLEIHSKENIVKLLKPITYQEINGKKIDIESNFIIEDNFVKFNVEQYDKENILIIDPELLYSTYLGGNSDIDIASSVAVDDEQIAYIVGPAHSTPIGDAYLIKIDTTLSGISSLKYMYYLGGNEMTQGYSVALDKNKNAYITGMTNAKDFPIVNGFQTAPLSTCDSNAFLTKIDTNTSTILYSTYIGGRDVFGV